MARRFPPLKSLLLFLATSLIVKCLYIIPLYYWRIHPFVCSFIRFLQFILLQEFSYILKSSKKTPTSLCFISTAALFICWICPPISTIWCEALSRRYFTYKNSTLCTGRLLSNHLFDMSLYTVLFHQCVLVHRFMYVNYKLSSKTVCEWWKGVFCLWDAFVSLNRDRLLFLNNSSRFSTEEIAYAFCHLGSKRHDKTSVGKSNLLYTAS